MLANKMCRRMNFGQRNDCILTALKQTLHFVPARIQFFILFGYITQIERFIYIFGLVISSEESLQQHNTAYHRNATVKPWPTDATFCSNIVQHCCESMLGPFYHPPNNMLENVG